MNEKTLSMDYETMLAEAITHRRKTALFFLMMEVNKAYNNAKRRLDIEHWQAFNVDLKTVTEKNAYADYACSELSAEVRRLYFLTKATNNAMVWFFNQPDADTEMG
jgi:hypothetical protein